MATTITLPKITSAGQRYEFAIGDLDVSPFEGDYIICGPREQEKAKLTGQRVAFVSTTYDDHGERKLGWIMEGPITSPSDSSPAPSQS